MARILQVCNTEFYLRGFLMPLVHGLRDRGHDVEAVCGTTSDKTIEGVQVHSFSFPQSPNPLTFFRCIRRFRTFLRQHRYNVVNAHNRNASIVARIAAWMEPVPHNIYTAHGFYFHDNQSRAAYEMTVLLERALSWTNTHTFSQSREDLDRLARRGASLIRRSHWIGNGIDQARFERRRGKREAEASLGLEPDVFRIATVGRIVRGKGLEDLVGVLPRLRDRIPNARLLIIGGNIDLDIEPWAEELFASIDARGLREYVHVTGLTDRVPDYLEASDVYVSPSRREGISRSMLEAMSLPLPVIATRVRGAREVLRHGENGLLYSPGDLKALAQRIGSLASNARLRDDLMKAARLTVERTYTQTAYVERQIRAIDEILPIA